ncbi:hypothetical protein PHYC_02295 [Phycisphaerales bacterium]|nr:hypothetical protein PHYC_02295 [Phycisphaerales bacterium]
MPISRRHFMHGGAAFSLGFAGLASLLAERRSPGAALLTDADGGFGPLLPDPAGILDLPSGFSYRMMSKTGEEMDDGLLVPGKHDGMAAFPGPDGRVILVRNHELQTDWKHLSPFGPNNERLAKAAAGMAFDLAGKSPELGGTTTLHYNPETGKIERQFMSLLGTSYNCAGGSTPWGSWLTCEETTVGRAEGLDKDHGWVFEVPSGATSAVRAEPITAMGRFRHEAVAIDPRSGCVYLTEDLADGVFYRYLPADRTRLMKGGRLQALCIRDRKALDTKNWVEPRGVSPGLSMSVLWVDLEDVLSPKNDLRLQAAAKGAARFARCEGIWWGHESAYFAATTGGRKQFGQVWRYIPSDREGTPDEEKSPGTLELFLEPNDPAVLKNADNLTVAPWGDLIVCEDGEGNNGLVGVTPAGKPYRLAMIRANKSETAGACFSSDGRTFFFNMQSPGSTFAVSGPWRS